jgi:integrase
MRGHAYKRGASWTAVYDEPSPDGKRRQRSKGGFPTQKAAQRFLTDQLSRIGGGTYVEPARTTVGDWCEQWLDVQSSRLRPSTWESYRDVLRGRVVPELGHIPLQSLTAAQIDRLYAHLLSRGRSDGRGGLSARSVRYTHTILRRALSDAMRKSLLVRNPTDAADPPSASEAKAPTMRTWDASEVTRFLEHVAGDRLAAAWRLAASTGMRRGEVLGLHWRDLDLDAGRATVVQTLVAGAGSPRLSKPKSGRGRSIALDAGTVRALRAHRKAQAGEQLALGPAYDDHGLVFAREDGVPLRPRTFSRSFARHARGVGLPVIRLHDLRHTWATLALSQGVHPKVVQERLGHASVAITLDIYSHAVPAMQEDAAERVAALWTAR